MLSNTVALLSTIALVLTTVVYAVPTRAPTDKIVAIEESDNRFCLLMPPRCGLRVEDNYKNGITYCTNFTPLTEYERILPGGFIVSNHYKTVGAGSTKYIQVTGRFDRDRFLLKSDDQGSQSDPSNPSGAKCSGYPYFVQFVEPNEEIYCLRCCMRKADCPTDRDTDGCKKVIPGDFS